MELAVTNLALNRLLIGQTIDQITAQVSFQLGAKTFRYSNSTKVESNVFPKYRSKTTAVRPIFLANWTTVARKILAEQQITSGSTAIFCLRSTWIELNPGRELRSSKNLLWGLKRNLVAIGIHFLWCCTRAPHVFIIWTVWLTLIATSVLRPADYYHNSRRPSCGQSNYASSATASCYRLFAGLNAPTNRTLSVEQCCEYIDKFT